MTNIPSTHPVIAVLLRKVEQIFGQQVSSQQAVQNLVAALGFRVNEDTIRRLWRLRDDNYASVRHSTLDILSEYAGVHDWETFVTQVEKENGTESALVHRSEMLTTDNLEIGTLITITWLPDRKSTLRYEGNARWSVEEALNSTTISADDTFSCRTFAVGEPLLLDNLTHLGQTYPACRIGLRNGLSSIAIHTGKS